MCLFLEPLICGEAKSTDSRALGFWTNGRTHRHDFEKGVFQNPAVQTKSNAKRGRNALTPSAMRARSQFLLCPPATFFVSRQQDFWLPGKIPYFELGFFRSLSVLFLDAPNNPLCPRPSTHGRLPRYVFILPFDVAPKCLSTLRLSALVKILAAFRLVPRSCVSCVCSTRKARFYRRTQKPFSSIQKSDF